MHGYTRIWIVFFLLVSVAIFWGTCSRDWLLLFSIVFALFSERYQLDCTKKNEWYKRKQRMQANKEFGDVGSLWGWGIGPGNMMWRLCRFRCSWGTSAIIASVIRSACQSNRRSSRGAGKQRLSAVAGISGGQEDPSCDSPTFDLQHSCNISSSVSPKGKGATNANSKKKSETHATKWGESFSRGAVVAFSEGRCRSLGVFSVFHSQLFPVTKYRLPTTNCQLPASRQRKSQKRY